MAINNLQPLELTLTDFSVGYSRAVLQHLTPKDQDIIGKVHWIDGVLQPKDLGLFNDYIYVNNLTPGNVYSIEYALYDAMVTDLMLSTRTLISVAPALPITTLVSPTISSHSVEAEIVDVGVSPATVVLQVSGEGTQLRAQYALTGSGNWVDVYLNAFSNEVVLHNLPEGFLDIRIQGSVSLVDNSTDLSAWSTISNIDVRNAYSPPEPATNMLFTTAKLAEPTERYDVRISWDWERGSGANIREFSVHSIPASQYASNPSGDKWQGEAIQNAGAAQSTVITNHPFNTPMLYRVSSIAWGPVDQNTQYSDEVAFEITLDTPIDNDFTTETGIELSYAHIKGLTNVEGEWLQSFLVDAATGSVSIGLLKDGKAPISFDPVQGNVNVDGSVIANDIVSANFILANLDGEQTPNIRTITKEDYGDPSSGFFLGYSGGTYKFDLGDDLSYLRYDGDTLYLSNKVVIGTPGNSVPIGTGTTFIGTVYKNNAGAPSTPTGQEYPPVGWTILPETAPQGSNTYVSVARISELTGEVHEDSSWGPPSQFSGQDGESGDSYLKQYRYGPQEAVDGTWTAWGGTQTELHHWAQYREIIGSNVGTPSVVYRLVGQPGSGSYTLINGTGVFPTDSVATQEFYNAFGRNPTLDDHLTYIDYAQPNTTTSTTKRCNSLEGQPVTWSTPKLTVSGDIIIDGTISGDKLIAKTIKGEQISSTTTIVAGVGTTTAGISGDDSLDYANNQYKYSRFWAGSQYPRDNVGVLAAPFHVDNLGKLTAANADIQGTLNASEIYGSVIEGSIIRGSTITGSGIQASYIAADVPLLTLSWYNQEVYGSMSLEYIRETLGVDPYMGFQEIDHDVILSYADLVPIASYDYSNKEEYVRYVNTIITPHAEWTNNLKQDTDSGCVSRRDGYSATCTQYGDAGTPSVTNRPIVVVNGVTLDFGVIGSGSKTVTVGETKGTITVTRTLSTSTSCSYSHIGGGEGMHTGCETNTAYYSMKLDVEFRYSGNLSGYSIYARQGGTYFPVTISDSPNNGRAPTEDGKGLEL